MLAFQRPAPVRQCVEPLVGFAVSDPAFFFGRVGWDEFVDGPREIVFEFSVLLLERVLLDAALALQVALPELEVEVLGFTVALELAAFLVELLSLGEPVGVHLLLALFQDFFSLGRGALGVLDLTRDGLVHRLGVRLDRLCLFGNLGLVGLRRFAPLALLRVSRSLGLGRLLLSLGCGVGGGLGRRLARSLGFLLLRPLLLLQLVHDGALGGSFLLELAFRALGGVSLGLVRRSLGLCDFLGASLEPSLGGGGFVLRGTIREPELLGVRLELRLNDEAVLVEQLRPGRAGFLSRRVLPGCPFLVWLFSFGRLSGIRRLGRGRGLLDRVALRVLGHDRLDRLEDLGTPRVHPRRCLSGRRGERVGHFFGDSRVSFRLRRGAPLGSLRREPLSLDAPRLLLLGGQRRGQRRAAHTSAPAFLDHLAVVRVVFVDAVGYDWGERPRGGAVFGRLLVAVLVVVLWRAGHGDAEGADGVLRDAVELGDSRDVDVRELDVDGGEPRLGQRRHLGDHLVIRVCFARGRRWLGLRGRVRFGGHGLGLGRCRRGGLGRGRRERSPCGRRRFLLHGRRLTRLFPRGRRSLRPR